MNDNIDELKEFFKITKIIKYILKNFNRCTVDKNDLYDLIYCQKLIQNRFESQICNKFVIDSLEDILESINIIVHSLQVNEDTLDKILNTKLKDIGKLNKLKYDNKLQYHRLTDIVKLEKTGDTTQSRVDYSDRFIVAKTLLNNTSEWTKHIFSFNRLYNISDNKASIDQDIINIGYTIHMIESQLKSEDKLDCIGALVQSEFLYDTLKQDVDTYYNMVLARQIIVNESI